MSKELTPFEHIKKLVIEYKPPLFCRIDPTRKIIIFRFENTEKKGESRIKEFYNFIDFLKNILDNNKVDFFGICEVALMVKE